MVSFICLPWGFGVSRRVLSVSALTRGDSKTVVPVLGLEGWPRSFPKQKDYALGT